MKPLVSVIIACYNASSYIDQCISSLMKQTYQQFEIIVCDDASTDDSMDKLKKWSASEKRVRLLHNVTNKGTGYTRNRCLEIAQGDFHMLQDIDDYSSPERMETLLDALVMEEGISFVSSQMYAFEKDGSRVNIAFRGKIKEYPTKWNFLWTLPFCHATTMFRHEVLASIKGYLTTTQVNRQEDYEMMMRAYAKGFRGKNIDRVLYFYRYDISNISRIQNQHLINYVKIRYRGFKAMGLLPWGLPFVLKPYLAHLYHLFLFKKNKSFV